VYPSDLANEMSGVAGFLYIGSFIFAHLDMMRREMRMCAADFSLLNLPKGKSLGRSKPATNS
jgi:hypothetical protein